MRRKHRQQVLANLFRPLYPRGRTSRAWGIAAGLREHRGPQHEDIRLDEPLPDTRPWQVANTNPIWRAGK